MNIEIYKYFYRLYLSYFSNMQNLPHFESSLSCANNWKYLLSLSSQLALPLASPPSCFFFNLSLSALPAPRPTLFAKFQLLQLAPCSFLSPIYSHLLCQLLPVSAKFRAKCSALFLAGTVATSTATAACSSSSSSSSLPKGCDDLEPSTAASSALFEQNGNAPHGDGDGDGGPKATVNASLCVLLLIEAKSNAWRVRCSRDSREYTWIAAYSARVAATSLEERRVRSCNK